MNVESLLFLVPDLSDNCGIRAWSLGQIAEALGLRSSIIGPMSQDLWPGLSGHGGIEAVSPDQLLRRATELVDSSTVLISIKPLALSLGIAREVRANTGAPLLADMDDLNLGPGGVGLLSGQLREQLPLPEAFLNEHRTVSNSVLAARFGGTVIPHTAPVEETLELAVGPTTGPASPCVVFAGTVRPHKGMDILRQAVASLPGRPYSLVVTAKAPADAEPWEHWLGPLGAQEAARLRKKASVIAVPSLDLPFARYQLPQKLIDALAAGRPIVVSDLPVLRDATHGGSLVAEPGSATSLVERLAELGDATLREEMARRARAVYERFYSPAVLATALERALEQAVRRPHYGRERT